LPEHFGLVTSPEGLTVHLTPMVDCKGLYVISKDTQRILVRELQGGSSSGPFDFIIYGFKTDDTGPPVIRSKMEKAVISPDTHVEYMGPPPVISNVNKLAMPKRPDHPRHPRHGNNVD